MHQQAASIAASTVADNLWRLTFVIFWLLYSVREDRDFRLPTLPMSST
jgi:hypothetical protein